MLVSILAFALFTVLNMFVISKVTVANAQIAKKFSDTPKSLQELIERAQAIAEHREKVNKGITIAMIKVTLIWPPFFLYKPRV
jgi:hypothetical protein